MDSITPKVAVAANSKDRFSSGDFHALMTRPISNSNVKLRTRSKSEYVFDLPGQVFGTIQQAEALFSSKTSPGLFEVHKSRVKCTLLNDGIIKVESFEHFPGLRNERDAFREVLSERLDRFLAVNGIERDT